MPATPKPPPQKARQARGTAPAKTARPAEARLSRDAWLDAAYQAVAQGGFEQLRVLALADTLGVTRGSFYWHFTDHADLLAALLARWREREEALAVRLRAGFGGDPQTDLEGLLDTALAQSDEDLDNLRFELALRSLGRRDPDVARLLLGVDRLRLALLESRFQRLTDDPQTATDLAALFYLAIVGANQALSRPGNPAQAKTYLKDLLARYLIRGEFPKHS